MAKNKKKKREQLKREKQNIYAPARTACCRYRDGQSPSHINNDVKFKNIDNKEINKNVFEYMNAQKRIIKFDNIEIETINLTSNIICFKSFGFFDTFMSILTTSQYDKNNDLDTEYLFKWNTEKDKNKIMYLKLDENDNVVCFAILHRTNFDEFKTQTKPHILDYIYTYSNYRNMGYAQSLIKDIKKHYEFTAFCMNDISRMVFTKCDITVSPYINNLFLARTN